jgi:hypothetical protein
MNELLSAIAAMIVGGLSFAGFAYAWMECRRRDEVDRRFRREIENAAHKTYANAQRGRRDAA